MNISKTIDNAPSNDNLSNIKKFITNIQKKQYKPIVCIDLSGSTVFNNITSHDNQTFDNIYAQALKELPLENDDDIIFWSTTAREVIDKEPIYMAINNCIPLANQISDMNGGTSPENIIPLIHDRMSIIVTDGDIGPSSLSSVKINLQKYETGPIFLVIIPHINNYKDLYQNNEKEEETKDKINITIPQAFSQKLAGVFVWSYKRKKYEIISQLSMPWLCDITIDNIKKLKFPINKTGDITIKVGEDYKNFNLPEFLKFASNNIKNFDEISIKYLTQIGISSIIKQNGSLEQKNTWNEIIKKLYLSYFDIMYESLNKDKVSNPEDLSDRDKFEEFIKKNKYKINVEKEYNKGIGGEIQRLYVEKTVGEMTSIGSAKVIQTQMNVSNFQSMSIDNKLKSISSILIKDICGICNEDKNVFSVINFPIELITEIKNCTYNIEVRNKNKTITKKLINFNQLRSVLDGNKPSYHFIKMCDECSNHAITMLRHSSDPEYGITKLIPHNYSGSTVYNRLMLCPFISPNSINESCNPNIDQLSYARQWFRGIISKMLEIDVASQECLTACLIFLTSIANEDNANIIYANQLSLIRGGKFDRYPQTIKRLFKPDASKISNENMIIISTMYDVIQKAKIPILPECTKLILLCLVERKVNVIIHANKIKSNAEQKLNTVLSQIISKHTVDQIILNKFGIDINEVKSFDSLISIKSSDLYKKYFVKYLSENIDIQHIVNVDSHINNILQSVNINQIAIALGLSKEYLSGIVNNCGMSESSLVEMIKSFTRDLQNSEDHNKTIVNYAT